MHDIFGWCAAQVLRWPKLLILLSLLACGVCLYYAEGHLSVNTNTADLVSPHARFQTNWKRLEKLFPQDVGTIVIVVESSTPELSTSAVKRLGKLLRADKSHFASVYIPDEGDFFEKNALLYLNPAELDTLANQLSEAQPFLGRLSQDNSIEGLLSILNDALTAKQNDLPIELSPVLEKIHKTTEQVLEGKNDQLSWQQLMLEDKLSFFSPTQRFIVVKPKLDYSKMMPAEESIEAIHRAADKIQDKDLPSIKVSITGEAALENDELAGVSQGVEIGTAFSIVVVGFILYAAFRSIILVLATLAAITVGMVFSAGFAALAIGELNLISVAYAVSNIGLGVEYAIHFCLRFRDDLEQRLAVPRALLNTFHASSPSLVLSACSTAIGLYAFIPTDYKGVSELGILAGSSLFICLFVVLTVLPALLKLARFKVNDSKPVKPFSGIPSWVTDLPIRHARPICYMTLVLTVMALGLMWKVQVDFNPIDLRDPASESVKTFKELLKNKDATPMTLTVLSNSPEETLAIQDKLERLPSVEKTVSVFSLIPQQQEDKLARIEELALIMGPQFNSFPALARPKNPELAIRVFLKTVQQSLLQRPNAPESEALIHLRGALELLLADLDALREPMKQALIDKWQVSLIGSLPVTLKYLQAGLLATPIAIDNLPRDLKDRWLSHDGVYRIQVFPKEDLNRLDNLQAFITDVQKLAPDATDLPVLYYESMQEVIKAFEQALLIAVLAIILLLLVVRRNLKETVLIILPLLLGGLFTVAGTVLIDMPFNFANIIVLPLLLGMGVENGIHMVERLRYEVPEEQEMFGSSHLRGIFFGALTSIFGFMGLVFSPHRGIASIGVVIVMGIVLIMLCTFVILPAFAQWWRGPGGSRTAEG